MHADGHLIKGSLLNSGELHETKLTMPKPGCALIGGTMAATGAPGAPGAAPA